MYSNIQPHQPPTCYGCNDPIPTGAITHEAETFCPECIQIAGGDPVVLTEFINLIRALRAAFTEPVPTLSPARKASLLPPSVLAPGLPKQTNERTHNP